MPKTNHSEIYSKIVGQVIRQTRQSLGLTQAEVARRLQAKPSYVAAIEAGSENLTLGALARIAEALGAGVEISFRIPKSEFAQKTQSR